MNWLYSSLCSPPLFSKRGTRHFLIDSIYPFANVFPQKNSIYWDRIVAKQFFSLMRIHHSAHVWDIIGTKTLSANCRFDLSGLTYHIISGHPIWKSVTVLYLSLRMSGTCWHKLKIFASMIIKALIFLDRIKAWVRRIWKPSASQSVAENQHKQDQLTESTEEQQYQCCSIECIWYFKRTVENIT